MTIRSARVAVCAALALAACGDHPAPEISVGPVSFTQDQLLGLSTARKTTLAHLAAFGLAVADSSTDALGAPLVSRWIDDVRLDILAADLTLEKNGIGDDVLEARYRMDPEFELTVRHILFMSERWRTAEERAKAKAKAERALAEVRNGADFAETAARLSEEPGAKGRQGLLQPGREGAWVDEFWKAASALEVGQISPVTETEYGYHILRLEKRDTVPFSEARSRVAREVARSIEDPATVLDGWLDARTSEIQVAEGVLGTPLDSVADDATLASWQGGRLTLGEYRAWAATQPASWNAGGMGGDADTFRGSIVALARRRMALDEARKRSIEVPGGEQAKLQRKWGDQAYQWSASLGFQFGWGPSRVAEAALAALGRSGQSTGIARTEVDDRAPLLAARYDMRVHREGS